MSMFCGKAEDEQTKQRQKQQVWIHLIRCASLSWQTQTRCHIASQADVDRHIIFFPLHPFFTLNRVERHENAACQLRWIVNQTSFLWEDSCPGAAQNRRVQARLQGSHYTLQSAFTSQSLIKSM